MLSPPFAFRNHKKPTKALAFISNSISSGISKPDPSSIVASLTACAKRKDLPAGKIIHGIVYKCFEQPTLGVQTALIDMYGKNGGIEMAERVFRSTHCRDVAIWTSLLNGYLLNGDIDSAKEVFDEMPRRNVITWTTMMVGLLRRKNPVEALELFARMRSNEDGGEECNPTTVTIVALLSGCADIGALHLGRCVHGYIVKRRGFATDVAVSNGLIDMYGKSGILEFAVNVFDSMMMKDLFSWTSMISSLALHGRGRHALSVFSSMVESGIVPNEVTFLSILSACSHAGLVVEGEKLFENFVNAYRLKPRIEHFGCMVDLYVRAGLLEKALGLVEGMPIRPDGVIWRSLLSGCMENGNVELAEAAGRKVLELEPYNDGTYILLGSMYRSQDRWQDSLKSMKTMRDERIKKTPGCSWIEVKGVTHEFLADVVSHHGIVLVLDTLISHSRLDLNSIFFNQWT